MSAENLQNTLQVVILDEIRSYFLEIHFYSLYLFWKNHWGYQLNGVLFTVQGEKVLVLVLPGVLALLDPTLLPSRGLKLRPKPPARYLMLSLWEVCALAKCQGLNVLQLTNEFIFWTVRAPVMFYGVFSFFQNICCHVVLGCSGL